MNSLLTKIILFMLAFNVLDAYALDSLWEMGDSIPGRRADNPRRIKLSGDYFELSDSADTYDWCLHKFYHETVHYVIELEQEMNVMIITHGSKLKNISMRVGMIHERGDTLWTEAKDSPEFYVNMLRNVEAWDYSRDASTQAFWMAIMPPGRYAVELHGVYTQEEGTSNGLIVTTFLGIGNPNIVKYPPVPKILQSGMRWNPEWLKTMPADFNYDIYHEKELTETYLGVRREFDGKVYYAFGVADTLDMTFTTKGYGTQLWIWPTDSVTADITAMPADNYGWPLYCKADKVTKRRMPPGKYIMAAADTLPAATGTIIGYLLESAPPPPPPYWKKYAVYSPSVAGHNYVREQTMINASGTEWAETTTYYDGLGRQSQIVVTDGSPMGGDIVEQHTEYDLSGRLWKKWLPAVNHGSGSYVRHSGIDYKAVYGREQMPYSMTEHELSALDRPLSEHGPGAAIYDAGAAIRYKYGLNQSTGTDYLLFAYNASDTPDSPDSPVTVTCSGCYPHSELTVKEITDEDGKRRIEFTDPHGRKVLDRVDMKDGTYADTYYIYDSYGNLTAVLPPEASTRISGTDVLVSGESDIMDNYCYVYTYDKIRQQTSKKLPGCERVYFKYDKSGRCYLSQDGVQRKSGRWRFVVADALGRECISGTCSAINVSSADGLIRAKRADGNSQNLMGYDIAGAEIIDPVVLTANYYDDYSFIEGWGYIDGLSFMATEEASEYYSNAKGLLTGQLTAVPVSVDSDSLKYLVSAHYYDNRDRMVQSVAQNHLGSTDRTSIRYDFSGRAIGTGLIHSAMLGDSLSTVTQHWEREYDRQGREMSVRHRINGGEWQTLSEKAYDPVGRLLSESVGSPESGIIRKYEYDIRSHPTSISSYGYSQSLGFTYGGNVSSMKWKAYGPNETERKYVFGYDALSRLTSATYSDNDGKNGLFDTSYEYDLNGNITALMRNGLYDNSQHRQYGLIDDLTYEYAGNRLVRITDGCSGPFYQGAYHFSDGADEAIEYSYDSNGNMTADLNRGITGITYDINNRPRAIVFNGGAQTRYIYDAAGVKLRTEHLIPTVPPAVPMDSDLPGETMTTVTDYCGDIIYENGRIERINLENGYLSYKDGNGNRLTEPEYMFYLRDHLGNNRVTLRGRDGGIFQIDHYYPFGLPMGCGYYMSFQQWRFGGKEFDRTAGLDQYDFEARAYDPSTARFTRPDDLAEKYYPLSPYSYCNGNPLKYIDSNGMEISLKKLVWADQSIATNTSDQIIEDLKFLTGLNLSLNSNGMLTYETTSSGEPVISYDKDCLEVGSKLARKILIGKITSDELVEVSMSKRTQTDELQIGINPKQIDEFINNSQNIDKRTLGFGMSFLHELLHTNPNGYEDVRGKLGTGKTVDTINMIRNELNAKGYNFGTRMNYEGLPVNNGSNVIIPFDQNSFNRAINGLSPGSQDKYIFY